MKKSYLLGTVCAVLFSLITVSANATLHGRLPLTPGGTDYQAAYDDVLDITWAQPDDAERTWHEANTWAAGLTLGEFSGWRLPYVSVAAGAGPFSIDPVDCRTAPEYACRDNELEYMYFHNLGGNINLPTPPNGNPDVLALFPTLQFGGYWFGTEFTPEYAWFFDLGYAVSTFDGKFNNHYVWAVRDGDVLLPHTLIDSGYTTIDPASGLEWLDLTFTRGVSAQDVLSGFGGYIDDGWDFATVEQVCGLFGALEGDITNCTSGAIAVPMNATRTQTLVDLLGNTAARGLGAYGMFNNIDTFPDTFGIACINDTATSCTWGGASSWLTVLEWASGYTTVGSFLVREYIEPPPSTLVDNGYTTIDTESGLEWLDLTFTRDVSAQDVLAGFGGYIYDGWDFATVEQVCGLLGALGDDTTNCTTGAMAVPMNPTKSATLVDLLGNTAAAGRGAYGMFNNIDTFPDTFGIACINDTAASCTWGGASSWLTLLEWASGYTTVGSYLVREYVEPPPSTLIDNGDTTIDTASGLEWLDLTFTQFDHAGNSVSAQNVLDGFNGYMEPGDQGTGWMFATVEQVCGLFGALGDDITECTTGAVARQMNPTKSATLVNLLGNTAASGRGAYGMFDNLGGDPGNFGIGCINDTATTCTTGGASSWLTQIEWAGGYTTVGSFLTREYIAPASTTLMTYSSRELFEADNPGFVIEDFEEAIFDPLNISDDGQNEEEIMSPLDATSGYNGNGFGFAPGDIVAGLVINEYPDSTPGLLIVYPDGFISPTQVSTQISYSYDENDLHLMFPAGVQSVGFDVYSMESIPQIVARVYSGETLLDTITVRASGYLTRFFLGFTSDEIITRVSLDATVGVNDSFFSVDNVTFVRVASLCPCNGKSIGGLTWTTEDQSPLYPYAGYLNPGSLSEISFSGGQLQGVPNSLYFAHGLPTVCGIDVGGDGSTNIRYEVTGEDQVAACNAELATIFDAIEGE